MEIESPKVFVSYSWDNEDHKNWVMALATRLRSNGVDAILDKWHLHPGEELSAFMEKSIRESSFVVIVCTPKYKSRSDNRQGGVGYEGGVITGEVMTGVGRKKFIPILRHGSWAEAAPSWCAAAYMIDLREDPTAPQGFEELLRSLLGARHGPPPLGKSPFISSEESPLSEESAEPTPRASSSNRDTSEWTEIKRLINQERPITRQQGLSRWAALSSSGHLTPPDVISVAEKIIVGAQTNDETAYAFLGQIKASNTPESLDAIARLLRVLAKGGFSTLPKTKLSLSYVAVEEPKTREYLFLWLEQTQPEYEADPGLAALLRLSQGFPPDLEKSFDRIERICQRYPRNHYAQQTFKLLTGKDLSTESSGLSVRPQDATSAPESNPHEFDIEIERETPLPSGMRNKLTPRQAMIAQALLRNWSNEAIAAEFGLSVEVVRTHVRGIFSKLMVDGRADLIYQAAQYLKSQSVMGAAHAVPSPHGRSGSENKSFEEATASGRQVTCVTKGSPGGGHESITHIGGANWRLSTANAIDAIRKNTDSFYTVVEGVRAEIVIVTGESGSYLGAHIDGRWNNSLLELGECPKAN